MVIYMKYELVAGLETHIELSTKTKLFCGCTTEFGGEQNAHCCPICIGLPGTLPKINGAAIDYTIMAGLATNCEISLYSRMDRKNYVYPDLPKAYQVSQFDFPLCKNGFIELSSGKKIRINRIHLEEDAGKLVHKNGDVYVDYNRGCIPLIEVVTEPDFRSADEILEYIEKLRLTIKNIGVSDCKMQEGSMRCDVNISVRPFGAEKFGTRTEIKNMNSITFIGKAIEYEYARQCELLDEGGKVVQETLHYIESENITTSARDKEDAQDYRYFPEPDIVPIVTTAKRVEELRQSLPENPFVRMARFESDYGIAAEDAKIIVRYKLIADFFEDSVKNIKSPRNAANLIISSLFRRMPTETEKEDFSYRIDAAHFNELLTLLDEGKLSANQAKTLFEKMLDENKSPRAYLTEADLTAPDDGEIEKLCRDAVDNNQKSVEDYKAGKDKALQVLVGYVMKATKGKCDGALVKETILKMIS